MACGCKKNKFGPSSKTGLTQNSALRPSNNINRVAPIEKQNIAQTSSQTPKSNRSESSINQEKRKIQQIRRDAIKKSFGK